MRFFLFREVEGFDFEGGFPKKEVGRKRWLENKLLLISINLKPLQTGIFGCQANGTLCFPGDWKIEKRVAEFRVIDGLFLDAKKKQWEGNGRKWKEMVKLWGLVSPLGIGKPNKKNIIGFCVMSNSQRDQTEL